MAGYSSRSDQLWHVALQLAEEETKSIPFAQQEEHGQRIQTKYNQLVSNLSCLGDIIAAMYQKEKLALKELEQIQHLQSTPIRANEELLSIIARKPRDVYECFLSLIKATNQLHLYQMLVSGDDTCDKAKIEAVSDHKDLIRRNFTEFSEKLDSENGLISLLYQYNVLTVREREYIFCMNETLQKNEFLLGLISKKSPKDFEKFLKALEVSGQDHLAKKLGKPEDSPADPAVSTTKSISHKPLPKATYESGKKPVPVPSFSKSVLPPKTHPKLGQKLIPSRYFFKPVPPPKPGTQSTSAKHYAKSIHTIARSTEKTVNFRSTEGVNFQARLKGLESRLQTDIAIKVTYASLVVLDKPGDCLDMCFHSLLQECHQMRKEVAKTDMELEQLRKSARKYSAAATLNEVLRKQLQSLQQELTSERWQSKKERMQLEEMINKLKTDILNEKTKCKRFQEEKILNDTVILKVKDSLKKAECDKQFFQQQLNELNVRLASAESELQKSKEKFEESNTEIILLRTERGKLKEACEILRKECDFRNDLEAQLLHTQENISLEEQERLEKERGLEKDSSLELAEEDNLEPIKHPKDRVKEKSLENDQMLNLHEELESEKHPRQKLEDTLSHATPQLEHLTRKQEDREITYVTQDYALTENTDTTIKKRLQYGNKKNEDDRKNEDHRVDVNEQLKDSERESHVIRSNHQFLVEHVSSGRLIDLLHECNCITDEEQDRLNKQAFGFYRNDALLQWMRTIPFKQDKGRKVLECFRQTKQNFLADLLVKGGVLIKSKISTKLAKVGLFTKLSSTNAEELKEKEIMVIERLNQSHGLSLSSIRNATPDIPVDDIVIAPYCHQEPDGIVIWFWCESKHGQTKLRRVYESGILLGELITMFKQLSKDIASSARKILVPTSVNIFVGDFESELPEHFQSDPVLVKSIKSKAGEERRKPIEGLAILDKELFVMSEEISEIEVYDSIKLSFSRRWNLKELFNPFDIDSCNRNKCLYIFDGKGIDQPSEILRVDPNGNLIKNWSTGDDYGLLSVTDDSNVVLTVYKKNKLNEYSPDGQLIRKINLSSHAHIRSASHAIKLTNGNLVVSCGYRDDDVHRVCIVDAEGKLMKSFGGEPGSNFGQMNRPVYLTVDGDGFVLVVDQGNHRVLLLDSNLEFKREILSDVKHGLRRPSKILLDDLSGRMLVTDNEWNDEGRILIFQFVYRTNEGLFI